MAEALQSIINSKDTPIYISVEPVPDCYELEPGETLTIAFDVVETGDALTLSIIPEGISIAPNGKDPTVLINGVSAVGRSWKFKHA